MNNIVFYFSGTGNSLYAAKTIAGELGNGEIVPMGKPGSYSLIKQYDTIGFVYPAYYWGLPKKVIEFVENLNIGGNRDAYFFSVATYGGDIGNAVYQMYALLYKKHKIRLNYGQKLRMFANYVISYNMNEKIDEITRKSNEELVPIIESIKGKVNNKVNSITRIIGFANNWFVKNVPAMDIHFSVNNDCTGCGVCGEVCPVNNIEMLNNRPQYNHTCEQCLACIHHCPQRAINYKNATQNRRRYAHPEISYKELSERNKT